jgi:5-methylcytosine-specific restriction endonuclease McrA
MCASNNNVKYCRKHDCSYVQRGSSDRMHCRECTNERNRNTVRSQKAKENKRQYDKNYAIKKRLENPDLLKLAQEKYKQTYKYKELINYYKFKNKEGKYSNIYCIECNDVRLYGDKLCSKCKLIKKYTDAYNYISVCKHCNKEFGIDIKLNNLGVVAQLNKYCSVECNKQLKNITKKKNAKIHRRKYKNKYGRIRDDKQWAKKYGNKYEHISRSIVYRKHKYICTSCGVKCIHPNKDNYNQSNAATLDHIIPKSKGGSHTYDNVTLLCRSCNTIKSDKILLDYKRNIGQIEIEFTGYIPQGSQLQLQLA